MKCAAIIIQLLFFVSYPITLLQPKRQMSHTVRSGCHEHLTTM